MVFRLPYAEQLARRGLYRRAAALYREAALKNNINSHNRERAVMRANRLEECARQARLERCPSLNPKQNTDVDTSLFSGAFSGGITGNR